MIQKLLTNEYLSNLNYKCTNLSNDYQSWNMQFEDNNKKYFLVAKDGIQHQVIGATHHDLNLIIHLKSNIELLINEIFNMRMQNTQSTKANKTTFLTTESFKQIYQQNKKSTLMPWNSYFEGRDHVSGSSFLMTQNEDIEICGISIENQDFIAECRTVLPLLLEEIIHLNGLAKNAFLTL